MMFAACEPANAMPSGSPMAALDHDELTCQWRHHKGGLLTVTFPNGITVKIPTLGHFAINGEVDPLSGSERFVPSPQACAVRPASLTPCTPR